jgi:glutamyl-tRNA reductase
MNLTWAGINHRSAPVEVRERLNIPELQFQNVLNELVASEDGFATEPVLRGFLAKYHHCDPAAYDRYLYWRRDSDVVRHLFRVAYSLDSMILTI